MSFNALSLGKLGIGFGALAVASIGLLAPSPVEADVPAEYHGGKKSKSVSVDYVRKQWELQELRLKGRIEPAANLEPYRAADKVSPQPAPDPAPTIPTALVGVDTAQPIELVLDAVPFVSSNEQQADAVDPKIAAALAQKKRNQAALLLILAEL
jgi:hypothetical protein